jgi:hypothetical protein
VGRRWLIVGAAVAMTAAFGCGENGSVPDDRIVKALKLEEARGGKSYAMGGDPFCEVDGNLLNDSDEIDVASEGDELGLVITDSDGAVGVQAVPPFDPECARTAKQALNKLE